MTDKNLKNNISSFCYDRYKYAVKAYDLNELEKKLLYLETLLIKYRCDSFNYKAPQLKTNNYYLTNDGYYLDCFVWYIFCNIKGRKVRVFGKSIENAIENTIIFFEGIIPIKHDMDLACQYIQQFEFEQGKKCNKFAKFRKDN